MCATTLTYNVGAAPKYAQPHVAKCMSGSIPTAENRFARQQPVSPWGAVYIALPQTMQWLWRTSRVSQLNWRAPSYVCPVAHRRPQKPALLLRRSTTREKSTSVSATLSWPSRLSRRGVDRFVRDRQTRRVSSGHRPSSFTSADAGRRTTERLKARGQCHSVCGRRDRII